MQRFALREGWSTFFLIALVVFTATWSTQSANWTDGLGILTAVTIVGLLVGLVFSQFERIPSAVAHLVALLIGTVVVMYEMTNFLSDNIGGRKAKLHYLWGRWDQWYTAISHGQHAEDLYLFVLMMAALLFILSYTSVWFVFRSRWIWLSLLLPGVVLFMNLGYSLKVPTGLVILYLIASILLMMRFSFSRKIERWRLSGTPFPDNVVWRGLWTASYVSLAVVIFGWAMPVSAQNQTVHAAWEHVNGPWVHVENTFNSWFGSLRGPGVTGGVGGFASFGDSFEVGGPLHLSDQAVVVVKGSAAPYLAAHRYDFFDGNNWKSDLSSTTGASATTTEGTSPLIPFQSGEPIPVPQSATKGTTTEDYTVNVLSPRGAVIYSPGELKSVTEPTQVQVAWRFYSNQELDVKSATVDNTPPLLWAMVEALQSAHFGPPPPPVEATPTPQATPQSGTPEASASPTAEASPTPEASPTVTVNLGLSQDASIDPAELQTIQNAQEELKTHSIRTQYVLAPDYSVTTLYFTGRLPVYSDIEAVFAQNGVGSGDTYNITSIVSTATSDQLRQAGTDYPVEITSRYLQIPVVTDRTRQLAQQLASGKSNPYDIASTMETFLRQNYKYNENVGVPPKGQDAVDWFLFNSKQGYCTFYASSMIEMLRALGIPSRIAVGFYPAKFDSASNGFLYRDLNAHAWVEVYFPSYGWVPFEPTAARAAINRDTPAAQPVSGNTVTGDPNAATGPTNLRDQFLENNDPGGAGSGVFVAPKPKTGAFGWAVRAMILVLLAIIGVIAYLWMRGLRGLSPATQLYTKSQRGASWGGVPVRSSMTPYEYASVVGDQVPGTRQHVRLLADLYVRERYGGRTPDSQEIGRARHAWLRLRGLMLRYFLVGRWRGSALRSTHQFDDD